MQLNNVTTTNYDDIESSPNWVTNASVLWAHRGILRPYRGRVGASRACYCSSYSESIRIDGSHHAA